MKDTFQNRLIQAMALRDIKQVELAKKTGISKSRISHYVNGLYEAKQDAIFSIAKALNISEAWLMGYDVPMERSDDKLPIVTIENFTVTRNEDSKFLVETLAAHISSALGLTEEMAKKVIEIARTLKDIK